MSPTGSQAEAPPARAEFLAAEAILQDDEEIILAIKPSVFFILLRNWQRLLLLAMVVGISLLKDNWQDSITDVVLVGLCSLTAGVHLLFNALFWVGRWYVLTNRHVILWQQFERDPYSELSLLHIENIEVVAMRSEALLKLGTLEFFLAGQKHPLAFWTNLPQADDVAETIRQAVHHAQKHPANQHHE